VKLGPAWRVLQVALGALLFLWALGWLDVLRSQRVPYVILAALVAAGAMWVTESVVTVFAAMLDKNAKGPRA
jgi:hypothetical protein